MPTLKKPITDSIGIQHNEVCARVFDIDRASKQKNHERHLGKNHKWCATLLSNRTLPQPRQHRL